MAINKNHEFEELDGVKCAIVEKLVAADRVEFLKSLLTYNGYTVVVVESPAPKSNAAAAPTAAASATTVIPVATTTDVLTAANSSTTSAGSPAGNETSLATPAPIAETTYTVGVTNLMFNATNAIFGRLLKAPNGNIVTLAYWKQQVPVSRDWIPYYQHA